MEDGQKIRPDPTHLVFCGHAVCFPIRDECPWKLQPGRVRHWWLDRNSHLYFLQKSFLLLSIDSLFVIDNNPPLYENEDDQIGKRQGFSPLWSKSSWHERGGWHGIKANFLRKKAQNSSLPTNPMFHLFHPELQDSAPLKRPEMQIWLLL